MRNIDKFRKLESEELVEFIMHNYIGHSCQACIYSPADCNGTCRSGMREWFEAIDLEGTVLSKEEEAILNYCEGNCSCIEKDGIFIRAFGYEFDEEDDYGNEEVCKLLIRDENLFSWFPNNERIAVEELLKIKQVKKTKEEKNIETNETLYNLIDTCRNKLVKIIMSKNGDKYRPIKNTRREDVYEVVWDLMNLFKTFGLKTTYEVMTELQSGEVHKNK